MLAAGCGGDRAPAAEPVFERPDGTVIEWPGDVQVWCGPFVVEDEATHEDVDTLYIRHGRIFGDDRYRFWSLDAVVADIPVGETIRLPNESYVYTEPRGIVLGAWEENAQLELENVSVEDESSGTLRFLEVGCDRGDEIVFEVDAKLGSEISLSKDDRIAVRGTFRGRVGAEPREWSVED